MSRAHSVNICHIQYVSVSETGMKQGYPYTEMVIAMMTGGSVL